MFLSIKNYAGITGRFNSLIAPSISTSSSAEVGVFLMYWNQPSKHKVLIDAVSDSSCSTSAVTSLSDSTVYPYGAEECAYAITGKCAILQTLEIRFELNGF